MAKVSETTINIICRLCLKTIENQDNDIINDSEKDIIQIVLPQIDLNSSNNPEICKDCANLLQQSFVFKSKCLEIEDSIHDFKQEDNDRVNLEKVLGVSEDSNSKCIKICRMCLGYLENNAFIELDTETDLKSIIRQCLPEMDMELTLNPVICQLCEELLKEIYKFITLCNKNEEENQFYFEQSDDVKYELDKKDSPNVESALEFKEMDIKENFDTGNDNCTLVPETQDIYSAPDTNGQEQIYIISDNEGNTSDGTETWEKSIKRISKRRSRKRRSPDEDGSEYDNPDYVGRSGSIDTSDDEWLSTYQWRKPRETVIKMDEDETVIEMDTNQHDFLKGTIFCKYCYHTTTSELTARRHISTCSQNPYFKAKTLLTTTYVNNVEGKSGKDTGLSKIPEWKNGAKEIEVIKLISTKETTKKTNVIKRTIKTVGIAKKTKKTIEKTDVSNNTIKIVGTVKWNKKPIKNTDESKNTAETVEKTMDLIEDPLIEEPEIVYNVFTFAEKEGAVVAPESAPNSNLEGIKINYLTMESEMFKNKDKRSDIELAIKDNKKNLFSHLEVLTCNNCSFNSRSNLKMALHCSSHAGSSKKVVDYSSGHRSVFYCVSCTKSFETEQHIRSHLDECLLASDDKVFLIKVGKIMHCTKCYFDSDEMDLVLEHLRRCGDIKIACLER